MRERHCGEEAEEGKRLCGKNMRDTAEGMENLAGVLSFILV